MKRMWIGVALLLAVLVIGIALTVAFHTLHGHLSEKLEDSSTAALAGDWKKATSLAREARSDWEKCRSFTAAVADHEPLEEMDSLFAQLAVWERLEEPEEFAATAAHLARLAEALRDSQAITWWNLL